MKFAQSSNMKRHEKKVHSESKASLFHREIKEDISPFLEIKVEPPDIESDPLEIKSEPLHYKYSL